MKTLVVGLGIGQLYKKVNEELGHKVVTVDINPATNPDFSTVKEAITAHRRFDTAHVCVPNYLHVPVAEELAAFAKIVFVEKPGAKNVYQWVRMLERFPNTRFMMSKNNQYRSMEDDPYSPNIEEMKTLVDESSRIYLSWRNKNRIPHPGSWFTTKAKAFGGVTRDLLPHLYSYLMVFETEMCHYDVPLVEPEVYQDWNLNTITDTDYGTVNPKGIYDVDDYAATTINFNGKTYHLHCDWKNNSVDDVSISFAYEDHSIKRNLGLCPESAYKRMIQTAIRHICDDEFWKNQRLQDMWIHQKMEDICK